jgi:hypothetical protein
MRADPDGTVMRSMSWGTRPRRAWTTIAASLVVLTLSQTPPSQATNIARGTEPCPITGTPCQALHIISYGSYIYSYPSKYDLVFFPDTEPDWFFYCPQSGYVSLGGDFKKLDGEEKTRISAYLAQHRTGDTDLRDLARRLHVAEELYALRNKDQAFWIKLYRVMAYLHEKELQDTPAALAYRLKALALIEEALKTPLPDGRRKEYLYLAGEYHRWNKGYAKAAQYFAEAKALPWADENGSNKGENDYVNTLIRDRRGLLPPEVVSKDMARWDQLRGEMIRVSDEANRLTWKINPRRADAESYERRLQSLGKEIRTAEARLRRTGAEGLPLELEYLVVQYNEHVGRFNEHVEQLKALSAEYDRIIDEHNAMVEMANALAKHIEEPDTDMLPLNKPVSFAPAEPWRSTAAERPAGRR